MAAQTRTDLEHPILPATQSVATKSKPNAASTDRWFITYRDEQGRVQKRAATASSIIERIGEGELPYPNEILASRSQSGPFDPLTSFPEFRELTLGDLEGETDNNWDIDWNEPKHSDTMTATLTQPMVRKPIAVRSQEHSEIVTQRETISLQTLVIGVIVTLITAILAYQIFIWDGK